MHTRFAALVDVPSPLVFTHFETKPDAARPGFYAGVLIIQKGIAKGHFAVKDGNRVVNFDRTNPEHAELRKYQIVIGDETLDDVARCGAEAESTKCKLDHGATIKDIVGDYAAFRRNGDKVRADLTLMESTTHRAFVEELFAKFSKKVGNSIDFDFRYDIKGDVAVARCVKLNSVDIVDAPAATNSLFNETQPPTPTHMPLSIEDLTAITGVVEKAVDARFGALQTGIETRLGKVETTITKLEEDKDDDKKDKDDDKDDGNSGMSEASISKAVLAAVREVLPKATVDNLNSFAAHGAGGAPDEYAEKLRLCEVAGITGARATAHIARKWPLVYNAKFGQPTAAPGNGTRTTV